MKPLRLHATNLRTWRELDLEVPVGVCAIVGPNGAGKSSLVSTIDLALFGTGGELKRAATRDSGAENVVVELELEHAGEDYRIRRGYSLAGRGKPLLDFERGLRMYDGNDESLGAGAWLSLTKETVTETQARIEETLGLSRQTFRASSYLAQGDGAAFTMADPRERKAILLDALGVNVWDRLHELAGKRRRTFEETLSNMVGRVETLEGFVAQRTAVEGILRLRELERSPIADAIDALEAGIAERRQDLDDARATEAEQRARRVTADEARRRLSEAEQRLKAAQIAESLDAEGMQTARAQAAAIAPLERLVEIDADLELERAKVGSLSARQAELASTEAELRSRLDTMVVDLAGVERELEELTECPTCGQDLDERAQERASASLRARKAKLEERQGAAVSRAQTVAQSLESVRDGFDELEAEILKRELERQGIVADLSTNGSSALSAGLGPRGSLDRARKAAELLARIEASAGLLEKLRAELPALQTELAQAEAAAGELSGTNIDEHVRKLKDAEARLEAKRVELRTADEAVARAGAQLRTIDEHAKALAELAKALAELADDVELVKIAERAYGRDGIPALILESQAIPELEAVANAILSDLGREYRVELRTQRETQAGTVKEVLDILVETGAGVATYEDFSGGERTRLDLALRIALARLLAARRGTDVRVLVIDEPAYLDDEGFGQLAEVLRGLAGEFDTVLVVSHVEALRDAFDSAIVVSGGGDSGEPSRLEEVGA